MSVAAQKANYARKAAAWMRSHEDMMVGERNTKLLGDIAEFLIGVAEDMEFVAELVGEGPVLTERDSAEEPRAEVTL